MDALDFFRYADITGNVFVRTSDDDKVEPGWFYKLQKSMYRQA